MKHHHNRIGMSAVVVALAIMVGLMSTSCNSREKIRPCKIKKLVNQELYEQNLDQSYVTIDTGYYEENDEEVRFHLRQLAAAGMITYNAQCITEKSQQRVSSYDWWSGVSYRTVNRTKEHVFVSVSLTKEGEKYLVEKPEPHKKKYDFKVLADLFAEYPESSVDPNEVFVSNEQPKAEETDADEYDDDPGCMMEEDECTGIDEGFFADDVKTEEQMSEYEKCQAKEQRGKVYLKAGKASFNKCALISVDPTEGTATCQVQIKLTDVTPFGRVLAGFREKACLYANPEFEYYQDKGWRLVECEIEDNDESFDNVDRPEIEVICADDSEDDE